MTRDDPLPDIVQIAPATGWLAIWRDTKTGELLTAPVALWALVRHAERGETWHEAEGLDAAGADGLTRCEADANFLGYAPAGAYNADDWKDAQP